MNQNNYISHSIKACFSSTLQSQDTNKSSHENNTNYNYNNNNNNNIFRLLRFTLLFSLFFSLILFTLLAFSSSLPIPSPYIHFFLSRNPSPPSSCCNLSDPNPGPTNLTHIVFGLGGSSKTWEDRRAYSQLWWDPKITRGFVWLDDNPPNATDPETFPPYRVSTRSKGFFLGLNETPTDSDRMARIVKETFDLGLPDVKWFVMGDDDTVFFPENLVTVLSKYDYREMYYVGAPSESVEQDEMHGYETAFGGGGFAVSYGLAWELVKILDDCIKKYHSFYGSDEKVAGCVADLGVPLTKEPGFHQLDVRGDAYGLLAAHPVAPLVSLHHLLGAVPLFPGQTQVDSLKLLMRAYHVDPPLTLQQSFCFDHRRKWSISVSWGYTVQLYPSLIPSKLLSMPLQTFLTWRSSSAGPFVFNTRPMKDDPCERPIIYYLDHVNEVGEDETYSNYKRVVYLDGKQCDQPAYKLALSMERIVVSASKTSPEIWTKAFRRQCCEIVNSQIVKRKMRLKIRSCKPKEAIVM